MTPRDVSRRKFQPAVLAAATALLLGAGCSSAPSNGAGNAGPAQAMPFGSLAYVGFNLDTQSAGWKQFAAVGQRFPGWQHLVDQVLAGAGRSSGATDGARIAFRTDIKPWLGPSAAFAVTSLDASSGTAHMAFYVASTDDRQASAFLRKAGDHNDGTHNGYTLFTSSNGSDHIAVGNRAVLASNDLQTLTTLIDTRAGHGGNLASDPSFASAMKALPAASIVRGWINTQKLSELAGLASISGLESQTQAGGMQLSQLASALHSLDSLSFAAWASAGGYHLTMRTTLAPGASSSLFAASPASSLTRLVPADAFAYLAFGGFGGYLRQAFSSGRAAPEMNLFARETGISITHDLLPLLEGDDLVYAAPGLPVRASAVLKPANPAAAAATIRKLTALIGRSNPHIRISPLPGGAGQRIQSGGLVLLWRRTPGGLIIFGDDVAAGKPPTAPLLNSPAYAALLRSAGVPSGADVAVYVNLPGMLRLLPVTTDPDVQHVGAVLAWTSSNGRQRSGDVFVQVR